LEDVADKFHLENTLLPDARWLAPVGWKKNKSGRSKADGLTDDELSFLLTESPLAKLGKTLLRSATFFINASGFFNHGGGQPHQGEKTMEEYLSIVLTTSHH